MLLAGILRGQSHRGHIARACMRLCVLLVMLQIWGWPTVARAATIEVDQTGCTLPEAITAANTDQAFAGCSTGSGVDTIIFAPALTVVNLSDGPFNHDGLTATPSVTTTIIISGGFNGVTVARTGSDPYRLFYVGAAGNLTLQRVTVQNGATTADGAAIFNAGVLTLHDSRVVSNTTSGSGGGIYSENGASATLVNTDVLSNVAAYGGGLATSDGSTLLLDLSRVVANRAAGGGGIYNDGSILSLNASLVVSNTVVDEGGGIANYDGGEVILTNTLIVSNSAGTQGGGLFGIDNTLFTLTDAALVHNRAGTRGGGIALVDNSQATVVDSEILDNHAIERGGGLHNAGSQLTITNTHIATNTAEGGGGIHTESGASLHIAASTLTANEAAAGGALYHASATTATLTSSQLLTNVATAAVGSAIYQLSGTVDVTQSCLVGNADEAVSYALGNPLEARENWWGAADGPSGAGVGNGDSVSTEVNFTPFLTSAILGCATRPGVATFHKSVAPSGPLLPGQPLTYTLTVSNSGDSELVNLLVNDPLPAAFQLTAVISSGASIVTEGNGFRVSELAPAQAATLHLVGKVDPALAADITLTNTATLSNALTGLLTATTSNPVVVPKVSWSSATYSTSVTSASFTATLILAPTTPYMTVTVQATISDTVSARRAAVLPVVFAPNSSSQPVVIALDAIDDELTAPQTLALGLQALNGAALGTPANATFTVYPRPDDESNLYLPRLGRQAEDD